MTRLAWMTALALATITSVAVAQPNRDYDARRYRERDRATRDDPSRHERYDNHRYARDRRWVPLAVRYSATTQRQAIAVAGRGGRFDRIRVEGARGAPVINKVVIEYLGDPNAHAVELYSRLPRGSGETIRLNGERRINRIIVYTEPSYRGAYSIYGA